MKMFGISQLRAEKRELV